MISKGHLTTALPAAHWQVKKKMPVKELKAKVKVNLGNSINLTTQEKAGTDALGKQLVLEVPVTASSARSASEHTLSLD